MLVIRTINVFHWTFFRKIQTDWSTTKGFVLVLHIHSKIQKKPHLHLCYFVVYSTHTEHKQKQSCHLNQCSQKANQKWQFCVVICSCLQCFSPLTFSKKEEILGVAKSIYKLQNASRERQVKTGQSINTSCRLTSGVQIYCRDARPLLDVTNCNVLSHTGLPIEQLCICSQ